MKNKNKKDEALNELFSEYIGEQELPPEGVTFMAKEALKEEKARAAVTERQTVTAVQGGGTRISRRRLPVIIACAAAALIVVAVALVLILGGNGGGSFSDVVSSGNGSISLMTLDEFGLLDNEITGEQYELEDIGEIAPFVPEDGVEECDGYVLRADYRGYSAGDIVAYRMECVLPPGVEAELYVEADGISCSELERFKSLPERRNVSGRVFYSDMDAGVTYLYFVGGGFGYNLRLFETDEEVVYGVLKSIAASI